MSIDESALTLGRLTVSVWEEMKMGAPTPPTPPGGLGKLGMGTVGLSFSSAAAVGRAATRFFLRRVASRSACSSLKRALKGLGLRNLMGLIFTAEDLSELADGWKVAEPRLTTTLLGEMLASTLLLASCGLAELLNLFRPLLSRLELARKAPLELPPNDGVFCGAAELAGVAMSVGFTLFLLMSVATVVLSSPLGLNGRFGFLSLMLSLMTGANVLPGRLNGTLVLILEGLTATDSALSSTLEVSTRSSSISWKLLVGWIVGVSPSWEMPEDTMTSTWLDSRSGTTVLG